MFYVERILGLLVAVGIALGISLLTSISVVTIFATVAFVLAVDGYILRIIETLIVQQMINNGSITLSDSEVDDILAAISNIEKGEKDEGK